jgi:hypothetical protein
MFDSGDGGLILGWSQPMEDDSADRVVAEQDAYEEMSVRGSGSAESLLIRIGCGGKSPKEIDMEGSTAVLAVEEEMGWSLDDSFD